MTFDLYLNFFLSLEEQKKKLYSKEDGLNPDILKKQFSLENWKAVNLLFVKNREHYTLKNKYHEFSDFSIILH